jgi:hypothetical protein
MKASARIIQQKLLLCVSANTIVKLVVHWWHALGEEVFEAKMQEVCINK